MTISESQRLHLFKTLEERLGPDDAVTMMALLPDDTEQLVTMPVLRAELELLEARLEAKIERTIREATRTFVGWTMASQTFLVAAVALLLALG